MPIERRDSGKQIRSILIAIVSFALVLTLGYAVVRAATGKSNAATHRRSDGRFTVGAASSLAKEIAADGPVNFPDPSGAQRLPIFVSHTGGNSKRGWYAFEGRPPDGPDDCFLTWRKQQREFVASCDDSTYPVTGEGLRQFTATVNDDGELVVDLTPEGAATTTTPAR